MPLENPSYVMGEDCATSLIVKQSTAADHTALKCGFGEMPIGVIHEGSREAPIPGVTPLAAKSGESARIYGPGESCEVDVGTSVVVTAGFDVMSDANSKARRAIHGLPKLGRAEKTVTGPARARVFVQPGVFDNSQTVITKTQADTPVTVNDYDSGATLTNTGASGQVTFSLPPAVKGLSIRARVDAAQELRLDPSGSEQICLPSTGVPGTGGKYLTADAINETVHLRCIEAGIWDVVSYTGTWTAEA
jgi:hypothetical protein